MSTLPPHRTAGPGVLAFLGFVLLALLFVWPLPTKLENHITGDPVGDAGAYVWNAYVFSHNLETGFSIFQTDRILSFARESSLALHNNSLLLSFLAAPFIPAMGVIASFNIALTFILVLNAFCAYLLAMHETKSEVPSWLAGAFFGFSPFISARVEGHMSLATAFGLPLVVLFARTAMRKGTWISWALVGAALAICAASDPYYLIFGVLAVALVWTFDRVDLEPMPQAGLWWLRTLSTGLAVTAGAALLWILVTGGGVLSLGPVRLGMRGPHTPILILTIAVAGLLYAWAPQRLRLRPGALPTLKYPAFAGLVAGVLLFPWLKVAVAELWSRGGTSAPLWRSSPSGVDLLSFFMPNPTHPLFRGFVEPWMTRYRPDAFVEGVASWTVTGILVVAFLIAYRSGSIPRFWVCFTGVFAVLSLGPFVVVGGDPTYIPAPWAILRFIPGIGMVRSPTRFAVMATLGMALVLAHVLATSRLGRRRGPAFVGIGLLLGLETMGPPRRLFPAGLPESYRVVAEDRCDVVVLRLPTGIKDGTRERGRFNTETQFRQVFHGKRLLGGYLSRLSDETVAVYESHPTVRALLDLSEGKVLSKELRAEAIRGAATLTRELRIGFIAINRRETSQDLRDFVQEAFRPEVLHKALPLVISVPFGDSCVNGECGHLPGCPHRQRRPNVIPAKAGTH